MAHFAFTHVFRSALFGSCALLFATGEAHAETPDEEISDNSHSDINSDLSDIDDEGDGLEEQPTTEATSEEEPSDESEFGGKRRPDGGTQLLLGARYRALIVPKFFFNTLGLDGGRTVLSHGVGPEIGGYFGKTADGFMVLFSPWFVGYGLEETPFKGKNDDDTAWEIIESNMKVWYLTVDAMWDHKIANRLSVNVGMGVGLGIIAGKLLRNEAYRTRENPDVAADKDWPDLSYCQGPNMPSGNECPGNGNYNITQGGSSDRPPVYPWLNFQTGIRYQPVDAFVGRLDLGVGSSGFWIGLGADYSLFL